VILYFSENFSIKAQILLIGEFWDKFLDGIFMKKRMSKATGTYTTLVGKTNIIKKLPFCF
jgi:hypothetical protein